MAQQSLEVHDIYNIDNRLESAMRRLRTDGRITEPNRELLLKFIRQFGVGGGSVYRQVFYAIRMTNIGRLAHKNFDEMDKDDLMELVSRIQEKRDWTERTKVDQRACIKRFFKWLRGNDEEIPPEVRWIKTNEPSNKRKLPEDLVSEDDLRLLLRHARSARDRAMLWTLWESGVRIGELLSMRYKDAAFDEYGGVIHVRGKTGPRRVRIVSSIPALSAYLESHPTKNGDDALWLTDYGRPMSYSTFKTLLRRIKERSGYRKRLHPHLFRHTAATRLATELTEQQMKAYLGWTGASKMAAIYVHLSGAQMDEAILRIHGLVPKKEETNGHLRPKECGVCGTSNTMDRNWCVRCRHPISEKAKAQTMESNKGFVISEELVTALMDRMEERMRERI
ncbi:MAG: tyrosine-type recombinase/integrase [Candidatus Aenigmatarchaeota archaeon]|nr:MAG: tyrosine-type recombinase/integrase [Candidatus Aenigmarchaeota archaeon]